MAWLLDGHPTADPDALSAKWLAELHALAVYRAPWWIALLAYGVVAYGYWALVANLDWVYRVWTAEPSSVVVVNRAVSILMLLLPSVVLWTYRNITIGVGGSIWPESSRARRWWQRSLFSNNFIIAASRGRRVSDATAHEAVHMLAAEGVLPFDLPLASAVGAFVAWHEGFREHLIEGTKEEQQLFIRAQELMERNDLASAARFEALLAWLGAQRGAAVPTTWWEARDSSIRRLQTRNRHVRPEPGWTYPLGVGVLGFALKLAEQTGQHEDAAAYLKWLIHGATPRDAEDGVRGGGSLNLDVHGRIALIQWPDGRQTRYLWSEGSNWRVYYGKTVTHPDGLIEHFDAHDQPSVTKPTPSVAPPAAEKDVKATKDAEGVVRSVKEGGNDP